MILNCTSCSKRILMSSVDFSTNDRIFICSCGHRERMTKAEYEFKERISSSKEYKKMMITKEAERILDKSINIKLAVAGCITTEVC